MLPFRIAVASHCFELPLKQALEAAAAIGAEAVQIDARNELQPTELSQTGRRQLLHRLSDLSLSVASLRFPTKRAFYDSDRLGARIEAAKTVMTFAAQLKASIVTTQAGRVPNDPESAEYILLRDILNDLVRHGNHVGVTLSLTPTRESADALAQLVRDVTAGPIGINFDPAAFVLNGHDPTAALRTLHQLFTHVQIRDAVRDLDGTGVEVPVGRGEVDWDEFLALIDDAGFRGWLCLDRTDGDRKSEDVAHAVEFLRRIALDHR